jgi:hypothetical protein
LIQVEICSHCAFPLLSAIWTGNEINTGTGTAVPVSTSDWPDLSQNFCSTGDSFSRFTVFLKIEINNKSTQAHNGRTAVQSDHELELILG